MQNRIREHIRSNIVGYIALFCFAMGGSAYALDGPLPGQNQVGSADIINGEVQNPDIGADSVASGKIDDRQVKNADLSIGASSSNTIADGGIQGVDVKNDTLTGTQILESSLGKVPNADTLDGIDSADFARGHSRVLHASEPIGFESQASGDLIVVPGYGTVRFDCNATGQVAVDYTNDTNHIQFVVEDQGNPNPTAYRLVAGVATTETAHVDADSVTYHVSNGVDETAVIMVAGQKFNDPEVPGDFCTLQATAIARIPF
jgi:hypothetical protein